MSATATKPEKQTAPAAAPPDVTEAPPKPTMPYVQPGMVVLWHRDGERAPNALPAMVMNVYLNNTIDLSIFPGGVADGVKHIDDPNRVRDDNMEGAWEHTDWMKELIALAELDWKHGCGQWA